MPTFFIKTPRILVYSVLAWCVTHTSAIAGGGPENLFLVVNPQSPASLAIANNYIHLRQIPAGNVLYLPWNPQYGSIYVDDFRAKILNPILEAIRTRRLSAQIDCVAYSSDFPGQVVFESDVKKLKNSSPQSSAEAGGQNFLKSIPLPGAPALPVGAPYGSINGMTYLWQMVLKGGPDYYSLQSNRYTRLPIEAQKNMPTLGFRNSWQFGPQGELVESGGNNYMLSVMLGVTIGRGNTVDDILHYLERSASADGTHPRGTIYFMKNTDIRSRVRHDMFPDTVAELEKLGVSAKIIEGILPQNKNDVQGAVIGISDFNWKASGSTILPGAICEHFTSYGGIMVNTDQQTPLSEFLRYGAAGASGTVIEPLALLQKFPLPMIQVHYARGCTLAEAFYQSVYAPYQLLIVGDPLCRPWANIPQVKVAGANPNDTVTGTLTLTPTATVQSKQGIDHFELFVNGSRAGLCKPGENLTLDTSLLPDGYHELRVVAIEGGLIQSQGRAIVPVITDNYGRKIQVKIASKGVVRPDSPLILDVDSPGSTSVCFLQNSRATGKINGEKGQIRIEAAQLGAGPVSLQVIGLGKGGPRTHVLAPPIDVTVETPETKSHK
jgi:hypothetical protein